MAFALNSPIVLPQINTMQHLCILYSMHIVKKVTVGLFAQRGVCKQEGRGKQSAAHKAKFIDVVIASWAADNVEAQKNQPQVAWILLRDHIPAKGDPHNMIYTRPQGGRKGTLLLLYTWVLSTCDSWLLIWALISALSVFEISSWFLVARRRGASSRNPGPTLFANSVHCWLRSYLMWKKFKIIE